MESGQRPRRGLPRRENHRGITGQSDVPPHLQRRGGRRARACGRNAQPVTVVRRRTAGDRLEVPEARRRSGHVRGGQVTGISAPELYYDPYDFAIDDDPYPVWRRLRDEAPLYYNEKYNFFALSRYEDVARELHNWETYRSGHGTTMDIILAGIQLPPGIILFEDPPIHDLHRHLLSRVFTPRRMAAIEPLTRQYCVRALDPLVGSDRFDFIADIGSQIPMRTIGYLLGIPEHNQEMIRDTSNSALTLTDGEFSGARADLFENSHELFASYIDWRADHPSDDLMTQLLNAELEEDGEVRRLTRTEVLMYTGMVAGAGNETTTRLIGFAGQLLAENPDQRRELADDYSLIPTAIASTFSGAAPISPSARGCTSAWARRWPACRHEWCWRRC